MMRSDVSQQSNDPTDGILKSNNKQEDEKLETSEESGNMVDIEENIMKKNDNEDMQNSYDYNNE